jgi:hypothetical protein
MALLSLAFLVFIPYHSYCITFKWFLYTDNISSFLLIMASWATVNPLLYIFNVDVQYLGCFIPLFLLVVKIHVMYKFREMQAVDDGRKANILFFVFMAVYFIVDEYANVAHENRVLRSWSIADAEYVRMAFHIVYIVIIVLYYVRVMGRDDGEHVLKGRTLLGMISLVIVSDLIADVILPVWDMAQDSIYGDLLKVVSGQEYFVAFALFFKRKLARYDIDPFMPTMRLDGHYIEDGDDLIGNAG